MSHEILIATSGGSSIRTTAQILHSHADGGLGRNRLWAYLREIDWAMDATATPSAIEAGFVIAARPMLVTGKNMVELWRLLGGVHEIETGEYDSRNDDVLLALRGAP